MELDLKKLKVEAGSHSNEAKKLSANCSGTAVFFLLISESLTLNSWRN
jgi:hypothetical protein